MSSFTSALLSQSPPIAGLDASIVIPARRLHLTLGVMSLVLPAAFFAALDRGNLHDLTQYVTHLNTTEHERAEEEHDSELGQHAEYSALLTDVRRGQFLQFSRGISVLLLLRYMCFIFLVLLICTN